MVLNHPIRPIGPEPTLDALLPGSMMWASPEDARAAAELADVDDFQNPAARTVFPVLVSLLDAGRPHDPTAVADELARRGLLTEPVKRFLLDATTAGAQANSLAPRSYATAIAAKAYRERFESIGKALVEAAETFPEVDLLPLLRKAGTDAVRHAKRLATLRGEEIAA
ncbi:DnaB-like helicase N-terminal domain-containing protein [Prescottella agglutinans]|uniref:Replicative DNA helicase n=1 Tax=Prescottella agglutinans TaxID=1644129 RepID=A0ABT6MHK1_9NOCA|nr:DnaB-like helicase N-terminal domain-containing protein [Prescottella agglutinans]MDH6283281.1 replicative DNA helicase [Prescottella agglutinans]